MTYNAELSHRSAIVLNPARSSSAHRLQRRDVIWKFQCLIECSNGAGGATGSLDMRCATYKPMSRIDKKPDPGAKTERLFSTRPRFGGKVVLCDISGTLHRQDAVEFLEE